MIRALRRRLVLIFGLLTSLVLAVMLLITCHLARSQYELSQEVLYQTQFQALVREFQQSVRVSDSWLGQLALDQDSFFYIELNGVPLHYSSVSARDPDRSRLLDTLRQMAETQGFQPGTSDTVTFLAEADGLRYRATVCSLSDYLLFYSQELTQQDQHLRSLTATYLLLGLAGVSALLVISWLLSRLATRPTERALREQQEFVAAASHELRSPLTVIRASLYTVRQSVSQPELDRHLALADSEADRMGRLVGDLLTLAGSGAGRWSLRLQPVELETVCIQLYDQFQPQMEQTGHPFQLMLPENPLPVISSDAHRLHQLLSILLSNGVDHTPAGTELALSAQVDRHTVFLSVIDHGPGIPDREKEAVFRRFYRSDQSRTDKQHFGLGLAIARELSDLLGGQLTVHDTPGGGATFRLRLSLHSKRHLTKK